MLGSDGGEGWPAMRMVVKGCDQCGYRMAGFVEDTVICPVCNAEGRTSWMREVDEGVLVVEDERKGRK